MSDKTAADDWLTYEGAADVAHIREHLHDDSPEGQAYRDALGLTIDTRYGVTRNRGDIGSFVPCENKRLAKWTSQDWGAPFTEQQRVVSEWSVR